MFIDAHTHLNIESLCVNWKEHLKHFQQVGGKILVNAGANIDYNRNGILIAEEAKTLFPALVVKSTIGFHPEDAKEIEESAFSSLIEEIEEQYLHHSAEVIALGECGIDLYRQNPPYPSRSECGTGSLGKGEVQHQQELFRLQAELARKLGLPLVIHSREGFEETLEVLRDFTDIKIYFHCRGYGAEEVRRVEAMFPQVWFGFTNVISYPSARKTRESLLAVQRAKILLETDAPFLPPQVFRGQTNVPKYVAYVYEKCAELFGMEKQELERQIEENFCALFGEIC